KSVTLTVTEEVVAPQKTLIVTGRDYGALLHEGRLWHWGNTSEWEMPDTDGRPQLMPTEFLGGASIVEMSGSTSGSLILDSENRVWTWGGPVDLYGGKSPTLVGTTGFDAAKVDDISAAAYVISSSDDHGHISGWGQNERGGLGSSKIGFVSSRDPVLLATNQFVEAVATNSGGDRYAYAYNFAYGQDVIFWWGQSNLPTK